MNFNSAADRMALVYEYFSTRGAPSDAQFWQMMDRVDAECNAIVEMQELSDDPNSLLVFVVTNDRARGGKDKYRYYFAKDYQEGIAIIVENNDYYDEVMLFNHKGTVIYRNPD